MQHADARAGGGGRSRVMLEPRLVVRHKGRGKGVYDMQTGTPKENGVETRRKEVARCGRRGGEK